MRYAMTEHATRRSQQRACEAAIEAIIAYGAEYRQLGRIAFYLGRHQVEAARLSVNLGRFERTAVVLIEDGQRNLIYLCRPL